MKLFIVSYKDGDTGKRTRSMSLAEATETARRLRFRGCSSVFVVPANLPQQKGKDSNA